MFAHIADSDTSFPGARALAIGLGMWASEGARAREDNASAADGTLKARRVCTLHIMMVVAIVEYKS